MHAVRCQLPRLVLETNPAMHPLPVPCGGHPGDYPGAHLRKIVGVTLPALTSTAI